MRMMALALVRVNDAVQANDTGGTQSARNIPHLSPTAQWTRAPISSIEDLRDAVYGAGLEATQMAKGGISGSLVFAERNGITFSSGFIRGTVALTGPLSTTQLTVGVGLHFSPGSWHWINEVTTGEVGVFHAGDEHDCHYTPGALAAFTLDAYRLEEEAREELVLDRKTLGGTGLHARHLHPGAVAWLRDRFERLHGRPRPSSQAHPSPTELTWQSAHSLWQKAHRSLYASRRSLPGSQKE